MAFLSATRRAPGPHATRFIFITMFLDAMGIGLIIPVMPDLITEVSASNLSQAAILGGYLSFIYAFMQFLAAPTIGNLSDRFGRRPVLLISLAALGIDYIIMGLAPTLTLLFIGRLIAGIAGATHATANAYVADVSPPEQRAQNFGLIGSAFGFGFVAGPVIGGFVAEMGTRAPFFCAAGLVLLNFVYGLIVLPETVRPEKRRAFSWKRANPVGAFLQAFRIPGMTWFFVALFLYQLAQHVYPSIWVYYTKEAFRWGNSEVGISLGVFGISYALVQGWLIRKFLARLSESRVALWGLLLNALGMASLLFVTEGWVIYILLPFTALGGLAAPAMNGVMSRCVAEDAQGELQGAIASIIGMTTILSPLMMTQLFSYFTADGAAYYLPAGVFGIAALITLAALIPLQYALTKQPRMR